MLVFCILVLMAVTGSHSQAAKREKTAGTLTSIKGTVSVIRGDKKLNAERGMEIRCEDMLETGAASMAELSISKTAVIILNENSALFPEEEYDHISYGLKSGQARGRFNVTNKIGMRGGDAWITAGVAEIDLFLDGEKSSQLYVLSGRAWWSHEKWSMRKTLKGDEFVLWTPGGIPSGDVIDKKKVAERLEWLPPLEPEKKEGK